MQFKQLQINPPKISGRQRVSNSWPLRYILIGDSCRVVLQYAEIEQAQKKLCWQRQEGTTEENLIAVLEHRRNDLLPCIFSDNQERAGWFKILQVCIVLS